MIWIVPAACASRMSYHTLDYTFDYEIAHRLQTKRTKYPPCELDATNTQLRNEGTHVVHPHVSEAMHTWRLSTSA